MPLYNRGKALNRDWAAGTWRVLLLTSAYIPNPDHEFVSDVVANEVSTSGTGYSRQDLLNRAVVIDNAGDRVNHNADTISWASLTASFQYAIVYQFVTNDAASPLLAYFDLQAQSLTALPFAILWNAGPTSGTVFRGT